MHYDPIKNSLSKLLRRYTFLRKLFYKTLGAMFLREWYVKRKIKSLYRDNPPEEILDAGSGFGQYTYFMTKRFPAAHILAVDLKDDQIEDCKYFFSKTGHNNCEFKLEDLAEISALSGYDKKFDLVLSVDVMEHIEDDICVLKNFYGALKSGGMVIINTPSNLGGSDKHSGDEESFIGEHIRPGYSKEDITEKLKSAGFTVESFQYTYGKWGSRCWQLGIKYPMQLLNKSKVFFVLLPFYYLVIIWWVWLFMRLDMKEKNKISGTGILVVAKK